MKINKHCEVCEKNDAHKLVLLTKSDVRKTWLCKSCASPVPRALLVMTEKRRNDMHDDLISIFNITDKYSSF